MFFKIIQEFLTILSHDIRYRVYHGEKLYLDLFSKTRLEITRYDHIRI